MHQRNNGFSYGGRPKKEWVADVPALSKPDVFPKPRTIKGEKMYVGKGKDQGKFYKKDLFESTFNVIPGKVKAKFSSQPLQIKLKVN